MAQNNEIIPITRGETFRFACGPDVPCFNACCRDLHQFLAPYDILRLKTHLGLSSAEFLSRYAEIRTGPATGLPVATLKPGPGADRPCSFVSPQGCSVYPARPSSCRTYPLARAVSRSREDGRLTERFMLLTESHCKGFGRGEPWTVDRWIEDQDLAPCFEMNDRLMSLIALKNQKGPEPLSLSDRRAFELACYDLDGFREAVERRGLLDGHPLAETARQCLAGEEAALLRTAMEWAGSALFGDRGREERGPHGRRS